MGSLARRASLYAGRNHSVLIASPEVPTAHCAHLLPFGLCRRMDKSPVLRQCLRQAAGRALRVRRWCEGKSVLS